jgi:hypothetical protein
MLWNPCSPILCNIPTKTGTISLVPPGPYMAMVRKRGESRFVGNDLDDGAQITEESLLDTFLEVIEALVLVDATGTVDKD